MGEGAGEGDSGIREYSGSGAGAVQGKKPGKEIPGISRVISGTKKGALLTSAGK
jgi:hypothetical protein